MTGEFEALSKAELVNMLQRMQRDGRVDTPIQERTSSDVVHELQVHQLELEMQNRELREAQQLLEESRSRYADLYDFAPVGYCTLSTNGRIEEANLTAAAFFKLDRALLVGRQLSALIVSEDRKILTDHLKACFGGNGRAVSELRVRVSSHVTINVQLVSTVMVDSPAAVRLCRTVLNDISALKDSERVLSFLGEAAEKLSRSLDRSQTRAAVEALSVPAIADACIVDLGDREERQSDPTTPQAAVMANGQPIFLPEVPAHDALRFNGAQSVIIVPLLSGGRARGTLTLFANRSRRPYTQHDFHLATELARRASLAFDNADLYFGAQQAATTREDILAVVSHDLRTPLAAIMLAADLLLYSTNLDHKELKQCDLIKRSGQRMTKMLTDLLDMSSIEAGKFALDLHPCHANSLLQEAADAFRALANEKKINIRVKLLPKDPWVCCDRDRLLQVFSNLIGNAIKFTPAGGTITLRAREQAEHLQFAVSDTGPGIGNDRIAHVFERFWQPPEHARRGRGLGLFIAKGIVEAMRGQIGVTSAVGEGTTFFFTLPVTDAEPTKASPARRRGRPDGFVLVVDDDPSTRAALVQLLAISGREIREASDGVQALELLACSGEPPSHIVVDLEMPNMDGREFITTIHKKPGLAKTGIVIVSSRRDVSRIASSLGVSSFFEKPVDASRLLEIVARN